MPVELLPEIQVQELPDGVRYRLRERQYMLASGCAVIFAIIPLIVAWDGTLFLLDQPLGVGEMIAWAAVASMVLWGGNWLVNISLLALVGRPTVELRGPWLWNGVRLGPWRNGLTCHIASVLRLIVHVEPVELLTSTKDVQGTATSSEQASWNCHLIVESIEEPGRPLIVHPHVEQVQSLAEDLRRRLLDTPEASSSPGLRQPVPVIDELTDGPVAIPEQPTHSRIHYVEQAEGVMMTIPPYKFLANEFLGLFWFFNNLVFIFGTPVLACLWWPHDSEAVIWFMVMIGLYWLIAVLMLKISLEEHFRSIVLRASPEGLEFRGPRLFHRPRIEYKAANLVTVYGFPSGVYLAKPTGDRECLALRIRDAAEAQWVATVLRRALRLPRPGPTIQEDSRSQDNTSSPRATE
jgi:hypothetical protein